MGETWTGGNTGRTSGILWKRNAAIRRTIRPGRGRAGPGDFKPEVHPASALLSLSSRPSPRAARPLRRNRTHLARFGPPCGIARSSTHPALFYVFTPPPQPPPNQAELQQIWIPPSLPPHTAGSFSAVIPTLLPDLMPKTRGKNSSLSRAGEAASPGLISAHSAAAFGLRGPPRCPHPRVLTPPLARAFLLGFWGVGGACRTEVQ